MLSNQVATNNIVKKFDSFVLGFCKCGCGEHIPNLRTSKGLLHLYVHGHNRKGVKYVSKLKDTGKPRVNSAGYLTIKKNGKYKRMHRKLYEEHYNVCLLSYTELDHINKLDNRIENLRPLYKDQHTKRHSKDKPRSDMSDRHCSICRSNTTYIDKKGPHWLKDGDGGFWCKKCADKVYWHKYKSKKKNVIVY